MGADILTKWRAFTPRTRQWLIAIAIGVVIELALFLAGHTFRWSVVVNAQNAALDGMMRASAAAPADDSASLPAPPKLVLVDINDETWRDPRWGGGEPIRAPRDAVSDLIERAFQLGAKQVVLDIAIEGSPTREQDLREDQAFAARLDAMLAAPWFGADRQLVLVRTLRQPLPAQARLLTGNTDGGGPYPEGYLDELRASPSVDAVIARSQGRMIAAAPFFSISSDHVVRDWELLQMVCERRADTPEGVIRAVPSVQLAVAARHFGLSAADAPWQSPLETAPVPCTPFPADTASAFTPRQARQAERVLEDQVDAILVASWAATHGALRTRGVQFSPAPPRTEDLGNRVVFRWASAVNAVSAIEMLHGTVRHELKDRVVLIGQTYAEAGDRHFTPLGEMVGPVVLLNAIDSMARYRVIEAPSPWVTLPLALAMIVFVGYVFARWSSVVGTLIAAGTILAALPWLSFLFFKHGVWLDFALPVLAIQIQRLVKSFEEYLQRRESARLAAQTSWGSATAARARPQHRESANARRRDRR